MSRMAIFGVAVLATPFMVAAQSLHLVGFPEGGEGSAVYGVDAAGQTVAGIAFGNPAPGFTWTRSGGRFDFGALPGMPRASPAFAISGDGSTVAGYSSDFPVPEQAYRWAGSGPLQLLGIQSSYTSSRALGVNGDGSIVVGRSEAFNGNASQAFRWTDTTGLVGLGFTRQGHIRSEAAAISRDGSTIVGHSSSGQSDGFVWRQGTGMVMLTPLPGTGSYSTLAYGTNHDGSIIVGISGPFTSIATVWHNGVPTPLASPVGFGTPHALAVNDAGSVIVGRMLSTSGITAFIWTPGRGMEPLSSYLTFNGIAIPDGVHLHTATGVSADGNTIVGYTGQPGTAGMQGFVITIPAPASMLLLLGVGVLRRRR